MKFNLINCLFAALLSLSVISCANPVSPSSDTEQIIVDGSDIKNEVDVSSLIDEINIIKLKESRGTFIGEAYKILKSKDHYIIFDKINAKRIVAFDNNGLFVKNVINIGKGPTEVVQINDLWLNDDNNLEIYDFSQKRILTFDEGFNFVKSRRAGQSLIFQSLIPIPKSSEFVGYTNYSSYNEPYEGNHYKVAILDNLLKIKDTDFHYDERLTDAITITNIKPFTKFDDTIRFSQNFDPFIYNITEKGISKKYELLYTHKPFPLDFETEIIQKNLSLFKDDPPDFSKINALYKGYTGFRGTWGETKDYIIFDSFDTDYNSFVSLYNKREKQIVSQAKMLTETSRFKMMLPSFSEVEIEKNEFISMWPGYFLKMFLYEDSPFWDIINEDIEANYIVNIKLK